MARVAVSNWVKDCLVSSYVFSEDIKVQTIYNGFNPAVFVNKNKRDWSTPRVLFFNVTNPFKGSSLFIDIMDKIDYKYELFVAGEKLLTANNYIQYIEERESL